MTERPTVEADRMRSVATPLLEIAYEDDGPRDGPCAILLHGWPDDVRTWDAVAPALQAAGYRTISPICADPGRRASKVPR